MMDGKQKARIALADAGAFNLTMQRYGVKAMIRISNQEELRSNCKVFVESVCIYRVLVYDQTTFDNVVKFEKEIRAAIATGRKKLGYFDKYISLRFDTEPFLTLEVDSPPGFILPYQNTPQKTFQSAIGNIYTIDAVTPMVYDLNVQHQTLVAAVSGHGKSQLLKNCLTGLLANTPRENLDLRCIDFKNSDLIQYKKFSTAFAFRELDANTIIENLFQDVEQRIESASKKHKKKILLAIDEGAELDKANDEKLASIMKMGRSLGVHVLFATQHPTAAQVGQKIARAFTHRFVGRTDTGQSALFASGVAGSGAELLRKTGSFLYVFGGQIERFQSYFMTEEMEDDILQKYEN